MRIFSVGNQSASMTVVFFSIDYFVISDREFLCFHRGENVLKVMLDQSLKSNYNMYINKSKSNIYYYD